MKKKLLTILIAVTMIFAALPLSVSAADNFQVKYSGYLDQEASWELFQLVNAQRTSYGQPALVWDNADEDYITDRAIELALYYPNSLPFIRPSGAQGDELAVGHAPSIAAYFNSISGNPDYINVLFNNPEITHFCAGVFQATNGHYYIAYSVYDSGLGGETQAYESGRLVNYPIIASDRYLNLKTEFSDGVYIVKPTNLKKGKTYYYSLYNDNKNEPGHEIWFSKYYTKSSNTAVAKITETGKITTLRAGWAKLTIKPNISSDKAFSKIIVVRPPKVTGVKATAPKKGAVKLTWTKVPGANGYQIYRSTSKNGTYKLVKTVTSGSTVSYTNTGLKKGKTYYYKVRGYVKYNTTKYVGTFSDKKYKKVY